MIRVFPRLDDAKLMELFRKGVEGQWSAATIDWAHPLGLDTRELRALGHVLTPVYLGEQTAMVGAGAVIPQFFAAHHTEAQLYLATFVLDEARHFEALTRFYERAGVRPLEVRELRDMFRYQARLFRSRDRIEWLWGILLSDVFARHFYGSLVELHPASCFAQIASRILRDEARHLAFAELCLRSELAREPGLASRFVVMRDELLRLMHAIHRRLEGDAAIVGIDGGRLFAALEDDIERRARRLHVVEPGGGEG